MSWRWKCIVCEQEPEIDFWHKEKSYEESIKELDERGMWPNVYGGTFGISFGYGSVHDLNQRESTHEYQSMICDSCFEKKKHLCRLVERVKSESFEIKD